MKNYILILFIFMNILCHAQAPLRINFQAVIRSNEGDLITSENLVLEIGFKSSLSSAGFAYRESHNTQTNAYGQVAIQIGNGTILSGNFNAIDWSSGTVTFEASANINGANVAISQQQLSSVPYALFATKAQSLSGADDIDNTNEIQSLNFNGTVLGISGHPTTINLASLLDNTDNQILSFNNNNLSISGGNSVNLSTLINDDDADPTNELQTLSFSNTTLSLSGGNSVNLTTLLNDADADPVNEIQHLSLSGSTLQLSQSGNTVNLGPYVGTNTDEQTLSFLGTSLSIANGNAVDLASLLNDADASTTNEIQDLQLSGNILSLTSDPSTIDLTPYLQNAQQVAFSNTTSGLSATTVQAAIDEVVAEQLNNLQEAYGGGSSIQLNGTDEFRIINSTAGSVLSTSNAVSGVGIGIELPLHKIHVDGTTTATTHTGYDPLEAITGSSYETGELHFFTEGDAANHVNIGVTNILSGTGFNFATLNMANNVGATQNYGSYGFATGASGSNVGLRGRVEGTNATSTNYGLLTTVDGVGNFNFGVNASSTGSSNENIGVRGTASGAATTSYGVIGLTTGSGTTNYGTYGRAFGTGTTNYGIYGTASGATTNYAGYFQGNVAVVTGGLEVSTLSSSGATVTVNDNLSITGGGLEVTNISSTGTTVSINDNLSLTGNITGSGNLNITGNISSSGNLSIAGPLVRGSTQIIDIRNESVYAGPLAGLGNVGATYRNVAVGHASLQSHTTGPDNVAIGAYSMNDNIDSHSNVAIGSFAGEQLTTLSSGNIAVGSNSLSGITNGSSNNIAIGIYSMDAALSGNFNIALGVSAMNTSSSAGTQNISVGGNSLTNINGADNNVVVGHGAGQNIDIESSNVLLGSFTNTVGNVQNGVAIGYQATVAQNDAIILGNVGNGNIRVGIGTNTPSEKMHVVGNAIVTGIVTTTSVTETSDIRLKENVKGLDANTVMNIINAINTYQYTWKADSIADEKRIQYGVIAQEIENILPEIVHTDAKGFKSVNYTAFIPFLLEALKDQQKRIEALQKNNDNLRSLFENELAILADEIKLMKAEKANDKNQNANKK